MLEALERLRWMRDDFSDEIPDIVLRGWMAKETRMFKVRRNWWNGLVGCLERMMLKGWIDPKMLDEVGDFVGHYTSEEFHYQPLTSREDISRANELIDKILGRDV